MWLEALDMRQRDAIEATPPNVKTEKNFHFTIEFLRPEQPGTSQRAWTKFMWTWCMLLR